MAASKQTLTKAVKQVKMLGRKDDTAIALTLRQLSEDSLTKLNSLLETIDVIELEKETKQKEKKGESKEEVFGSRILPQIRHCANLYLSSPKLDDFSLDIQSYITFSNKLRGGQLFEKNAEELLEYIDRVETNTQRFLLMVVSDKGFIFNGIRKRMGSEFEMDVKRQGYSYKTIVNYINLYELLELYPILMVCGLTTTELYTYRVMLLKHLDHDHDLDSKLRQHLKEFNNYCTTME